MIVEWSDEFALGIDEIDKQHQGFFDAAHRLYYAVLNVEGEKVVEQTLQFLTDYSAKHFRAEEAYMQRHNFPGLAAHKKLHADFLERLDTVREEYDVYLAPSQGMADQLLDVTQGWLINHIAEADTKYAQYIKQ